MGIKTSYSQSNVYRDCSRHWYYKYIEKWDSPVEGASTHFGSAFDSGISSLLKGEATYKTIFDDRFYSTIDRQKNIMKVFDNDSIVYSNADYDEDVLLPEDEERMLAWANDLKLNVLGVTGKELFDSIQKTKKNPYKQLRENELKYHNRCCWLSLLRKGHLLMEAFKEQFLPKVEQVLAIQKYAFIKDANTDDSITGFIDFVLKLKDYDKPVIIDLKTSANLYKQEQIENSDQLTLYAALEGQRYNTDLVGYVVCVKNIKKEKEAYCSKCGAIRDGRHKTCNAQVQDTTVNKASKIRCEGSWVEKIVLKPEVQVLIEQKSQKQMADLLIDQGNIIEAMRQEIVFKNTSKCYSWYGSKCVFFDLCHKGDSTGLKKKGS